MTNALSLGQVSVLLVYAAMAAYAVAFVAFAVDLSGRGAGTDGRRRAVGIAMSVTYLAAGFHVAGVVLRGIAAGRVPWANSYEFTLTFTCAATITFLVICRLRDVRYLGTLVTGPVLLLLGLATSVFYVAPDGVQPALQSYWLAIHVALAAIAAGLFSVGAAATVLQIAQAGREERSAAARRPAAARDGAQVDGPQAGETQLDEVASGGVATALDARPAVTRPWDAILERLPGSVSLERTAFRLNAIGFVLWTFTIVAGAIWAQHAWNRFWGWDPKETFSLIAWLGYAVYLHARLTKGWQGTRAAVLSLVGYGLVLFNFLGVNFLFSGLHSYTGLS